ncbi:hypothetical protein BD410DRAFT_776034 [Rickenella mellea]|uniref:Zn(2)-C6 fungal-type domain-containing protein n=1 Tax=Rickenella mellea TaxID=50990 RepID=A0A4Y7PR07_9AGAM|nr:hypothetical protein BD410DRAFT_776034 [Rickenella mellea]
MSTNPFSNPTSGPSLTRYPGSSSHAPQASILTAEETERANLSTAAFRGPKRKRRVKIHSPFPLNHPTKVSKACDACHNSKRRCDGTAPCSNCYFTSKDCKYTDASGNSVPAPRPQRFAVPTDPDLSPSSGAGQAVPQPYPAGAFGIIESPYLSPQDLQRSIHQENDSDGNMIQEESVLSSPRLYHKLALRHRPIRIKQETHQSSASSLVVRQRAVQEPF